jgi:hypothetical protein
MQDERKQNKAPPTRIIQVVSSTATADAILILKSLGIPPPLPPMELPLEQISGTASTRTRRIRAALYDIASDLFSRPKFWRIVIPPISWRAFAEKQSVRSPWFSPDEPMGKLGKRLQFLSDSQY